MAKGSLQPPGEGAKKLLAFIQKAGLSCAKAADALDTVHPALLAWLSGACRPDAYRRALIEAWTGGAVPSVLWLSEAERAHLRKIRPFKRAA
jgi:hypothetical protein